MSSLPKRRRVKRATILAKRSQLAKNNLYKKRSYKPLYEKLKANNNALAKALSKEKQECQYLFSEKIGLTSEVQELKVACSKRDDVISGVLKNARETLQVLVTISNCVENTLATIASCQQIVPTTRTTPRKSNINDKRESSSARRLSGRSPARGVVQPMVSGHTITKPTINLSRLNIQREYRIQNPPNLSDIEESLTPEVSPAVPVRTNPVRIPITRPLNYGATRVNRLPERLQSSMRTSDESERRSSVRSNRNSDRHSARRSRENTERLSIPPVSRRGSQVVADLQSGECLRSPRVALHDVSRLLHNSQSVNIRTLLENSSDMDVTQSQQHVDDVSQSQQHVDDLSQSQRSVDDVPLTETSTENESREIIPESLNTTVNDPDDPLEGPSWLLNSSQVNSSDNEVSTTINNSTPLLSDKDQSKTNRTFESSNCSKSAEDSQAPSFVNSRSRNQKLKDINGADRDDDDDDEDDDDGEHKTNLALRWANHESNFFRNLINNDDDDDATTNLSRFVTRKRGSTCDDDDDFTLMLKPEDRRKKQQFTLNDLKLPILESPIVVPVQANNPEPEQTTNVLRIPTAANFGNFTPDLSRVNGNETVFNNTGLMLPIIGENPDSARSRPSTVVEQESDEDDNRNDKRKRKRAYKRVLSRADSPSDSEGAPITNVQSAPPTAIVEQESDEDDNRNDKRKRKRSYKRALSRADSPSDSEGAPITNVQSAPPTAIVEHESDDEDANGDKRKRKKTYNRRVSPPDSPSDTEWAPTPKRKNIKVKRKPSRAKDPSSAKVVLQKLNEKHVKRRSPSPDARASREFDNRRSKSMQRDALSDSDGSSNASVTNTFTSGRPRRQKAPTNLQEPSLGKKMRRH